MTINLDAAQAMIARARSHATGIGVPMNIAVTDGGGHLLAFARMDGAVLGSIEIAVAKAKTSILFKGPSENLWEYCKPGGPAPATEYTNGGLIPYAGGVPLIDAKGELSGAIGVSGGMPAQDGEVARAAIGSDELVKKILITGAGSGLGRGTAIGLARAGHHVIATTQIWPQVTDLRRHVTELGQGDRITVDKVDILDHRDVKAAVRWDFDTFVSNAGIGDSGPIAEIPVELVRRTFETNVFSNLEMIQQVVAKFVDGGIRGRVVIVSSMGGMLTAYGLGAYCASKHALEAIASSLRDELAETGITIQTINPGPYDTGFNDRIADTTYRWHDDAVNFTRESDIRASFAKIMQGQFDPQEMIDKMVEVIGAEGGRYRTVWPPVIEDLIKHVQETTWTRRIVPSAVTSES